MPGTGLQWGRGSLPGCNVMLMTATPRRRLLQWGRGSLPGCNPGRAPDSAVEVRFNGAGDHSPDVTLTSSSALTSLLLLQWGRGSLPGCNTGPIGTGGRKIELQWGRGSLPGCNGSSVLARPGAACKGMDRRPVVLCPAADSLPCPLQEKALFFQSGCTSDEGAVF